MFGFIITIFRVSLNHLLSPHLSSTPMYPSTIYTHSISVVCFMSSPFPLSVFYPGEIRIVFEIVLSLVNLTILPGLISNRTHRKPSIMWERRLDLWASEGNIVEGCPSCCSVVQRRSKGMYEMVDYQCSTADNSEGCRKSS